jgi:Asparagine synthase
VFVVGNVATPGRTHGPVWWDVGDGSAVTSSDGTTVVTHAGPAQRAAAGLAGAGEAEPGVPWDLAPAAVVRAGAPCDVTLVAHRYGFVDLFHWSEGGRFLASPSLAALLRQLALAGVPLALDEDSVAEYLAVDFVPEGRTWVRGVHRAAPGSVVTLSPAGVRCERRWRYRLSGAAADHDTAVDDLHRALTDAAGEAARYAAGRPVALALSGGLDSRVTAALLKAAGVDVVAYFIGEPVSDAAEVARAVAAALDLPLRFPSANRELTASFDDSLAYSPMSNLEWCKYVTGRHHVGPYAALASGYLGDHLVGEWPFATSEGPADTEGLGDLLVSRCLVQPVGADLRRRLVASFARMLAVWDGPVAERKQAFWWETVNLEMKECGIRHDFGRSPHFSLFESGPVVELGLSLPVEWHLRNRFYRSYFRRRLPHLWTDRIRVENRTNDHKPIERWIAGNDEFAGYLEAHLDAMAALPGVGEPVTHGRLLDDVRQGRLSRNRVHALFRSLTVAAFAHTYLSASGRPVDRAVSVAGAGRGGPEGVAG